MDWTALDHRESPAAERLAACPAAACPPDGLQGRLARQAGGQGS
jgi:hypothetical protein